MPASRKIVVHKKKSVHHRRPAPKMLPAATTTRIVNKVLVKNGIRPGTPMHKKVFAPLKSFAIKHQRKLIAAAAFTAGVGARHYAPKVWARAPTRPAWLPHVLDPKQGNTNTRPMWQRFKNARGWKNAAK